MGIGCVLFLWTVLAAVVTIAGVSGMFVLAWGRRRRRRTIVILGGVTATAGGLVAIAAAVFVLSWVVLGSRPYYSTSTRAFEGEFGVTAPSEVASVQLQASGSTDSTTRFLRFSAAPQTIEALVRRRFNAVAPAGCERQFRTVRRRPEWWHPAAVKNGRCYVAEPFDDAFAMTKAWLFYDESSRVAHYYYIGVD